MNDIKASRVFFTFIDKEFTHSTHIYDTTTRDDHETNDNIKNIEKFFSFDKLVLVNQVHGSDIYFYKKEDNDESDNVSVTNAFVTADGIITTEKNVAIAVKTADCAPILILDSSGSAVCTLHCGWRGALSDLIRKSIFMLDKISNDRKYSAIIGPCISRENYRVDEKFMDNFLQESAMNKEFFYKKEGKNKDGKIELEIFFDLPSYVRSKLIRHGVEDVTTVSDCTYSNEELYPSYRRETQNNKICSQRMLSVICIK
jgi:polyphenol oxidase